jgi:DNA-directed RNA polymerase subunit RPC12/RpoP
MTEKTHVDTDHHSFSCAQCGAVQEFEPGVGALVCQHCGFENEIPESEEDVIEELDFHEFLAKLEDGEELEDVVTVSCPSCGADFERDTNVSSEACPFCATTVVAAGGSHKQLKPRSLLPFRIERDAARQLFRQWVAKLWFAPNDFKKRARLDTTLSGMYVPHWTFDAEAKTQYTGQRGRHYYVTVMVSTGKGGTTMVTQRRTAWTPVHGEVEDSFDDLLVLASHSLPTKYMEELEPWDLQELVPFQKDYLGGFRAESYQVGLEEGFTEARQQMNAPIRNTIRHSIGGDDQIIQSMHTEFDSITFKHILLPVWISAYRFRNRPFRFLVNARTGEVQGERPWSWIKIGLAVLGGLAVVGGAAAAFLLLQ